MQVKINCCLSLGNEGELAYFPSNRGAGNRHNSLHSLKKLHTFHHFVQ